MNSLSAELRAAFRSDNLSKHFGLVSEPGFQRDDLILAWLPAPRSYPRLASSAAILSSSLDKDRERGRRLSKAAAPFSKKAFCHW